MNMENTETIRARVLSLIDGEFESDAAFERALSLPPKTVNNWRRSRSASFMKMLPTLSEVFSVNVSELLNIPLRADTSELSDEELEILRLYRSARTLPTPMREALKETIESTINLYIKTAKDKKTVQKPKGKTKK